MTSSCKQLVMAVLPQFLDEIQDELGDPKAEIIVSDDPTVRATRFAVYSPAMGMESELLISDHEMAIAKFPVHLIHDSLRRVVDEMLAEEQRLDVPPDVATVTNSMNAALAGLGNSFRDLAQTTRQAGQAMRNFGATFDDDDEDGGLST